MGSYFMSPLAEEDLQSIRDYIASENPRMAVLWLDALHQACQLLASQPLMGHKPPFAIKQNVLFWPFKKNYIIVYSPGEPLEIVRVLHGARNLYDLLEH